MKKLGRHIVACCLLTIFNTAYAMDINPEEIPTLCPSVKELIAGGVTGKMSYIYANVPLYIAYKYGRYETKWDWVFFVAIPQGEVDDMDEALKIASSVLPDVSGNPAPVPVVVTDKQHNTFTKWLCMYEHRDYFVLAITPTNLPGIDAPSINASFNMNGNMKKFTVSNVAKIKRGA